MIEVGTGRQVAVEVVDDVEQGTFARLPVDEIGVAFTGTLFLVVPEIAVGEDALRRAAVDVDGFVVRVGECDGEVRHQPVGSGIVKEDRIVRGVEELKFPLRVTVGEDFAIGVADSHVLWCRNLLQQVALHVDAEGNRVVCRKRHVDNGERAVGVQVHFGFDGFVLYGQGNVFDVLPVEVVDKDA